MSRPPADAIIVPGRGICLDGTLPPDPVARVQKAVELYRLGAAPRIIMSGRWTFMESPKWPRTEAAAMAEYAFKFAVPPDSVITEDQSVDTIGNAYFTKTKVLEPHSWRRLIVVGSPDHLQRIKYVFEFVLGPDYTVEFVESENKLTPAAYKISVARERIIEQITHEFLAGCTPGNDEQIWQMLERLHPGYGSHAKFSVADLIKRISPNG